jgi:2-polyprenyl-3-methyl-5-hydroxy-6-metoxy-1,4-benzoquinol methylase
LKPEGALVHIALWGNLGPLPVAEAMFGMATSRVLMAGVRLGIFAELAGGALAADELAMKCGLDSSGTAHLLDCLAALGHVKASAGLYTLSRRARPWLDPASPTYIGPLLEFNSDQWEWWSGLEEVVRRGIGYDIHAYAPDDPRWERYIRAMYCLARRSGPEIARKLELGVSPTSVLDLAGGHGWFCAELCKRHAGLVATVVDLPASAAVGREIMQETGMSVRVRHVDGDILHSDLGGPHDAALCFQIIHHLSPEQNVALFKRAFGALKWGGTLAILDYFTPANGKRADSAAFLGMHFYLTSSAATYSLKQLRTWLSEAGFSAVRSSRIHRAPVQTLVQAKKPIGR